jgi:hypothetical protein
MKSVLLATTAVFALSMGPTHAADPSAPLAVTVTSSSNSGTGAFPGSILPPGTWTNDFNDQFPGTSLNLTNWTPDPDGYQDSGLASDYISECGTQLTVNNGLSIVNPSTTPNGTGCLITGKQTFNLGYYEADVEADTVGWSGFWTESNGNSNCAVLGNGFEADIIETNAPGGTQNIYWSGYSSCAQYFHGQSNGSLPLGGVYHVYGLDVEATGFAFYVDGTETASYAYTFPGGTITDGEFFKLSSAYTTTWSHDLGFYVQWVRHYHH